MTGFSIDEFGWMVVEAVSAILLAAWLGWYAVVGLVVGGVLMWCHQAIQETAARRGEPKMVPITPADWKVIAPHGWDAEPIWMELRDE